MNVIEQFHGSLKSCIIQSADNTSVCCLMNPTGDEAIVIEDDEDEVVENAICPSKISDIFPCGKVGGCHETRDPDQPNHSLQCLLVKILKESKKPKVHIETVCSILSKRYVFYYETAPYKLVQDIKNLVITKNFLENHRIALNQEDECVLLPGKDEIISLDSEDEGENEQDSGKSNGADSLPRSIAISESLQRVDENKTTIGNASQSTKEEEPLVITDEILMKHIEDCLNSSVKPLSNAKELLLKITPQTDIDESEDYEDRLIIDESSADTTTCNNENSENTSSNVPMVPCYIYSSEEDKDSQMNGKSSNCSSSKYNKNVDHRVPRGKFSQDKYFLINPEYHTSNNNKRRLEPMTKSAPKRQALASTLESEIAAPKHSSRLFQLKSSWNDTSSINPISKLTHENSIPSQIPVETKDDTLSPSSNISKNQPIRNYANIALKQSLDHKSVNEKHSDTNILVPKTSKQHSISKKKVIAPKISPQQHMLSNQQVLSTSSLASKSVNKMAPNAVVSDTPLQQIRDPNFYIDQRLISHKVSDTPLQHIRPINFYIDQRSISNNISPKQSSPNNIGLNQVPLQTNCSPQQLLSPANIIGRTQTCSNNSPTLNFRSPHTFAPTLYNTSNQPKKCSQQQSSDQPIQMKSQPSNITPNTQPSRNSFPRNSIPNQRPLNRNAVVPNAQVIVKPTSTMVSNTAPIQKIGDQRPRDQVLSGTNIVVKHFYSPASNITANNQQLQNSLCGNKIQSQRLSANNHELKKSSPQSNILKQKSVATMLVAPPHQKTPQTTQNFIQNKQPLGSNIHNQRPLRTNVVVSNIAPKQPLPPPTSKCISKPQTHRHNLPETNLLKQKPLETNVVAPNIKPQQTHQPLRNIQPAKQEPLGTKMLVANNSSEQKATPISKCLPNKQLTNNSLKQRCMRTNLTAPSISPKQPSSLIPNPSHKPLKATAIVPPMLNDKIMPSTQYTTYAQQKLAGQPKESLLFIFAKIMRNRLLKSAEVFDILSTKYSYDSSTKKDLEPTIIGYFQKHCVRISSKYFTSWFMTNETFHKICSQEMLIQK